VAFVDKTLTCIDCKAPFVFTAGEQEFHASKGFTNEPRRCTNCRQNRRSSRGDSGGFGDRPRSGSGERSGGFGDRGGFGGGGGGFGAPRREMYDAVCAECGKETQVPFQPSGSRPVYCRDCFSAHSPPRRGGGGGGFDRGGRDSRSSRY
jgi:CxxC-x17-CxxC domain-containing protein